MLPKGRESAHLRSTSVVFPERPGYQLTPCKPGCFDLYSEGVEPCALLK